MASCCETEERLNGCIRQISEVHLHTVAAGESKKSQGLQKKEKWDQQDEKGPQAVTQGDQQYYEERRKIPPKWPVVVRQKRG